MNVSFFIHPVLCRNAKCILFILVALKNVIDKTFYFKNNPAIGSPQDKSDTVP